MDQSYKNFAFEQIDTFLYDLLNDEEVTIPEIVMALNRFFTENEEYHRKQIKRIEQLKTELVSSLNDNTKQSLYESIKQSNMRDLFG